MILAAGQEQVEAQLVTLQEARPRTGQTVHSTVEPLLPERLRLSIVEEYPAATKPLIHKAA